MIRKCLKRQHNTDSCRPTNREAAHLQSTREATYEKPVAARRTKTNLDRLVVKHLLLVRRPRSLGGLRTRTQTVQGAKNSEQRRKANEKGGDTKVTQSEAPRRPLWQPAAQPCCTRQTSATAPPANTAESKDQTTRAERRFWRVAANEDKKRKETHRDRCVVVVVVLAEKRLHGLRRLLQETRSTAPSTERE
jgi:hypothetical protein